MDNGTTGERAYYLCFKTPTKVGTDLIADVLAYVVLAYLPVALIALALGRAFSAVGGGFAPIGFGPRTGFALAWAVVLLAVALKVVLKFDYIVATTLALAIVLAVRAFSVLTKGPFSSTPR